MKIRIVLMILLIVLAFLQVFIFSNKEQVKAEAIFSQDELELQKMTVILQLFYLDGEISEEIVTEELNDMESLWKEYQDWKLVDINTNQVVFKKYIDDISPVLKANGFFGLSEAGALSIYNGKPNGSNIIQSFFQIDIDKLESSKQEELRRGIPIKDKNNFQKVINAFKPYSRTADE